MNKKELEARLSAINEVIDAFFNENQPMLVSTEKLLLKIQAISLGTEEDISYFKNNIPRTPNHVIISCSAIKVDKGPGIIGIITENKNQKPTLFSKKLKAQTVTEASFDAIYEGLKNFVNLCNNPGSKIEIRSDHRLTIQQLTGDINSKEERLKTRRDLIWELARQLPVLVDFVWKPRGSTKALETAYNAILKLEDQ